MNQIVGTPQKRCDNVYKVFDMELVRVLPSAEDEEGKLRILQYDSSNGMTHITPGFPTVGKTLAFGVPAMMHVMNKRNGNSSKRKNPLCLVLSPTRELAEQLFSVLCSAGQVCDVKSVCVYGGTSKGPRISSLKSGVDMVIGTPGRMKDLMNMEVCHEVSFVVLDEADRMLDMGFEEDVRFILGKTCSARQMVMFSATWPVAVHRLAQEFIDPKKI